MTLNLILFFEWQERVEKMRRAMLQIRRAREQEDDDVD